ncbi:hypothetical protein ABQX22_18200 [Xanthomonas sp. WHRI 1810A]|uniref:hypothetical protein n=1 Tax=Xanthomonas sp. WHRI 1810A TaxID=3161565 RepID=UPI0032E87903
MNRTLVWPWHGMVRGAVVHLPNGDTRPYIQPPGLQTSLYGPGDTHLIQVEGIEPITPEEAASAPPGGEYWAGQALITGSSLYNRSLQGWIFQAEDGSRWRASFIPGTIDAESTVVQITLTRFGEFGVAPETHTTRLTAPFGQTDFTTRLKLFGNLGAASDVAVRLHSVSRTGRTAVLAWSLFNPATGSAERDVDFRPRAFGFYKVSLALIENALSVTGEVLFGFDDIYSEEVSSGETLYSKFGNSGDLVEVDRQPIIRDETLGDTVTYEFSPTVEVITGESGVWNGPLNWESTVQWLVMVLFDGETPKPCYLKFHDTYVRGEASFTATTVSPLIREEYSDGGSQTLDPGYMNITGGGVASGQGTVTWLGPGAPWSMTNQYSVSSSWDDGTLTVVSVDGSKVITEVYENTGFKMWTDSGAGLAGSGGDLPHYYAGNKQSSFVLYSNNLIAVTAVDYGGDQIERVEGVITTRGYHALDAPLLLPADKRHYGSYNPATDEFIVLSPDKVNWV